MEIDPYLLSHNVLNSNWPKFGIPPDDIPPPKTENCDSLDSIIPGFSTAVLLYQIASRREWKAFLDNECQTVHNEKDVYIRLVNIMNKALPKDKIIEDPPSKAMTDWLKDCQSKGISIREADLPKDLRQELLDDALKEPLLGYIMEGDLLEDAMKEDPLADPGKEESPVISVDTDLLEDAMKEDPLADPGKEELPVIAVDTDLLEDAMKEDPLANPWKEELPVDSVETNLLQDGMKEDPLADPVKEDIPVDSVTDLLEDAMKEDPLADSGKEKLPIDTVETDLLEDAMKENLLAEAEKEDAHKKGLRGNVLHTKDDLPNIMAYTLAVCSELVLYEKEYENNKQYMKSMPKLFEKFFRKNVKRFCNNGRYTQDHLKNYINSIKCPEKFLSDFMSENKYEYNNIADKFLDYSEKFCAEKSLEHSKLRTEFEYLPIEIYFRYKKKKFEVLKEICKCVKE